MEARDAAPLTKLDAMPRPDEPTPLTPIFEPLPEDSLIYEPLLRHAGKGVVTPTGFTATRKPAQAAPDTSTA